MNFAPDDFNEMVFNPNILGKKTMIEYYPVLGRFITEDADIELAKMGGSDKFLKHLAFMFDVGTPLKKISNYSARKREAMLLSKYKWNEKLVKWSPEALTVYEESNPVIVRLTVLFVRQFRSHDYEYYVAMERAYHRSIEKTFAGEGKDADNLKAVDEYKKRVNEASQALYMSKASREVTQETMMVVEEESLNISPEDIAKRIKLGQYIKPY